MNCEALKYSDCAEAPEDVTPLSEPFVPITKLFEIEPADRLIASVKTLNCNLLVPSSKIK
jgi:hypothetical protein